MENTHPLLDDPCTASHRTHRPGARPPRRGRSRLAPLLLAAAAVTVAAVGCGDEAGQGRPISAEVTAINVIADCDSGANPGDFDISLILYRIVEGASQTITVLDEVLDVRYTLSDGALIEIFDVWVEGEVPATGEQSVLVQVDLFEDDGGGSGPLASEDIRIDWDPDQACWVRQFESACAGTTGELFRDNLVLSSGSGCNAVMAWRVSGD